METKKKTLKISFSTQKGGVGKSTMTTLLASMLHYRLGFNVLVLDCDFPQHSLTNMRERDKKTLMQNEYHKKAAMKQFQTINKKAYPIIKSKAEYALEKASEYVTQSAIVPDVIFFDLPGTANTKGVLTTLKMMDFIFSPITADRLVVESTLGFTKAFLELPKTIEGNDEQELWLFWNQVDGREKTGLYEAYQSVIRQLNLPIMETRIMDSKRFRKETDDTETYVFRSSLLPAETQLLKATKMDLFIEEFLKITHL
ncbi:MAG TPA: ParA family protein [Candidatus Sphingobacterium stercorigallinarum]|uniref:CO dehydrogenase maturation factor n=1 Tax=Myroides odoratus TaxID=256 RepID=A0A378RM35_MYROD|nr:ParA family protein [Myroides odoratus]QQU05255.1 ParA family protein [Myroides odoratus]STZ27247.1 CO dehydrogenase maturation factor [Myroides odoratus]HIY75121.1 ParA family protein [Candidatus Sphingobacterium stercorigallinarum]